MISPVTIHIFRAIIPAVDLQGSVNVLVSVFLLVSGFSIILKPRFESGTGLSVKISTDRQFYHWYSAAIMGRLTDSKPILY